MAQPITTPMLIPRDILSEAEQKVYDQFKDNKPELAKRFTWWSMHDLMKYYHSGLMTKENDANMFSFSIDLTSSEMAANSARNPQLLSGLNTAMGNLNKITNEISNDFNDAKAENAKQLNETVMNATLPRSQRGGKNKKKWGGGVNIMEKYSADKIKTECLNDLKIDAFGSRDRIFIVDGLLPTVTDALKNQIAAPVEAPAAAAAGPAAGLAPAAGLTPAAAAAGLVPGAAMPAAVMPIAGVTTGVSYAGGRRRTRKGRRSGKKMKTHKRYKRMVSRK